LEDFFVFKNNSYFLPLRRAVAKFSTHHCFLLAFHDFIVLDSFHKAIVLVSSINLSKIFKFFSEIVDHHFIIFLVAVLRISRKKLDDAHNSNTNSSSALFSFSKAEFLIFNS
jgi:archaellum biogenesis ATPase FlaH